MKTILISLFSLLVSLAIVVPGATPVLAANDQNTSAGVNSKASLMIKAPSAAAVGQTVTITIFSKNQRSPVVNASVYALKISELTVSSDKTSYDAIIADYTSIAKAKGIFLGTTGNDGNVTWKFTDTNRYLLIAVKDGFFPGFARISITLAAKQGLNIKAPNRAEVGSQVTLIVTERFTNKPVANASVYAKIIREIAVPSVTTKITTPKSVEPVSKQVGVPKATIASVISSIAPVVKANAADFEADLKTAEVVQQGGILLGNTDEKGVLVYTFKDDGIYMLAAIKANYAPGFAKIAVTLAAQKKLDIKAPASSPIGQPVTITVFDRRSQDVVEKASVYAVKANLIVAPSVNSETRKDIPVESLNATEAEPYLSIAKQKGIFLGETGKSGTVVHTFTEGSLFVLVAFKEGYTPGFSRINILVPAQKILNIDAPEVAEVNQQFTIKVVDRASLSPVAKADVFAIKVSDIPVTATLSGLANNKAVAVIPLDINEIKSRGTFLGSSDENGIVTAELSASARYRLAAVRSDYLPGFDMIAIVRSTTTNSTNK